MSVATGGSNATGAAVAGYLCHECSHVDAVKRWPQTPNGALFGASVPSYSNVASAELTWEAVRQEFEAIKARRHAAGLPMPRRDHIIMSPKQHAYYCAAMGVESFTLEQLIAWAAKEDNDAK